MRAAFAAVLAGVLLAACSTSSGSTPRADPTPVLASPSPTHPTKTARPTPKPQPPPPAPPPHACYRLGYDDAIAPTSAKKPVSCTGRHTAQTFFVGTYDAHLAVDSAQVHRLVSTQCPRRFGAFVGGTTDTRRLSLLRTIWYTPTSAEADRGAHWFRCVAIALRGDQHLALLDGRLIGVLAGTDGRAQYGLCGTAEPGTTGFEQRICAAPHAWRALSIVDFKAGAYPGATQVQDAGDPACQDAARAVASDPLSYRWSYQWPTLAQWRSGQTYGVCWAPG